MIAPERPFSCRPGDRSVRRGPVRALAALWIAAWLLPAGASAFQRLDAITLESGENFAIQAVIDPAGDFAYVTTDTGPVNVVKIDLETFERVGAITLENGENAPYAVLIDHPGDFLYIGTISFPGRVVKIDLETFERVGAITLETGENSLNSAVIDPAGQFAYFGTGTVPGRVVKIDLETFERVGAITMEPDEDWLLAGVIDPAGDFAYFGTGTATRQVVKVDLATFQRVGAIDLGAGPFDQILSGVIDPVGEFAYFGTGDFPGQVAKVDLTSFEHVETITLASGEDFLFSAAIDPAGDFVYFGTFGEPGHVLKIDLETFERAEALTLEPGEDWVISAVVDPAGGLAYFGTATEPGRLVRVLLGDPQPIADITPESFDFEVSEGGDDTQILTVGNLGFADLVWAIEDPELIAFTHEGSSSGTLDGNTFEEADFVITSVADPDDVVPVPPFATYIPHLSSSITIEGIGTFDFVIPTTTFAEHLGQFGAPAVGFGPLIANEPVGVLWGPLDGVFASWDTTTPIGPINGPGFHLGWGFQSMETTGGVLAFDDTDLGGELPPFTFTAADLVCDDLTEITWLSVAPESGTTPPESSDLVNVTVDGTGLSPGTFAATLCLATNDPDASVVPVPITLTVIEGGAPELVFDPSNLDVGDVEVGTTSPPQTATLQNTGDADATGLDFSTPGNGFEVSSTDCGVDLPAGGSCEVSVTFTPAETGPADATLEVTSDQGASTGFDIRPDSYTAIMVDDFDLPGLQEFEINNGPSVTSKTFSYPNVQGSGTAQLSESAMSAEIEITGTQLGIASMTSNAILTVDVTTQVLAEWDFTDFSTAWSSAIIGITDWTNQVTLLYEGPVVPDFRPSGSEILTLEPGIDYQFLVIADSAAPSHIWGSITIVPAQNTAVLELTGNGTEQPPPGPELIFDPAALNFGAFELDTSSPPQTATLHNNSEDDATGLSFDLSGAGFDVDTGDCGTGLAAGQSCEVVASFTPSEVGAAGAGLEVSSDQGTSASLRLTGVGLDSLRPPGERRWQWLSPLPQGSVIRDVDFIDADIGWAVGEGNTILRTTDGGASWTIQAQGTIGDMPALLRLYGVDFVDANTGWVVGTGGNILHTNDGGSSWTLQDSGYPADTEFRDVDFVDANTGWVVGGRPPGDQECTDAVIILRTTDGGETWEDQSCAPGLPALPIVGSGVHAFHGVSFLDENTGWVVNQRHGITNANMYRTQDGGETWQPLSIPTPSGRTPSDVFFTSAETGYVTTLLGQIWRTTDGGITWTEQPVATNSSFTKIHFAGTDSGYAVAQVGLLAGNVVRTTDAGENWIVDTLNFRTWGLAVIDPDTVTVVGNTGAMTRTEDGGETWTPQWETASRQILRGVSFPDAATGTAVGNAGAIVRTEDGGETWSEQSSGTNSILHDVHFPDSDTGTAVGASGTIRRTTNGGTIWTAQSSGTSAELLGVHFLDADTGTAVGGSGTILRTENGGAAWQPQASGTANGLHDVHFTDADTGTAVGNTGTILRTEDGGATWQLQSSGTSAHLRGVYFADTDTGWVVGEAIILHTGDGGETWTTQVSGGTFVLHDVFFIDADNGTAVGEQGLIARTLDGGANWFEEEPRRTIAPLHAVAMTDVETATAVGGDNDVRGAILRRTQAPAVGLRVAPDLVDFGRVPVGDSGGPTALTLTGTGTQAVTIDAVSVPGAPFALADGTCDDPPFTLAPGESCTLDYAFDPITPGPVQTMLAVSSDAAGGPHAIHLRGTGGSSLSIVPEPLDLGLVHVGETGEVRGVTVINTSATDVAVSQISTPGSPLAADGGSCDTPPFVLAAGASCTLDYTFSPVAEGPATATVTFTSDAPVGSDTFTLQGTGLSPRPVIEVDPDSLDLTLEQGEIASESLQIGNLGGAPLTWAIDTADPPVAGRTGAFPDRSSHQAPGSILPATVGAEPATSLDALLPGLRLITPAGSIVDCDSEPGMILHDDGTVENGYSADPTNFERIAFVDRFTPSLYPASFGAVCVAFLTQGPTSLDFEIVVFADDGPEGSPGTELGALDASAEGIPNAGDPDDIPLVWFSYDISALGLVVESGSVYIGVRWTPSVPNVFVASDESHDRLPGHAGGHWWNDSSGLWTPLQTPTVFPRYRALFVRAVENPGGCLDPGDLSWLDIAPSSGSTPASGASTVEITIDSTALEPGDYATNLCIGSDDPQRPITVVPLHLTVFEPGEVELPVADISPDSFDFEVEAGSGDTKTLHIGNLGDADLVWSIEDPEWIAFTHEGSSSGTLDGETFEKTVFVITSVADPDDVIPVPPFATYIPHLSSSITIESLGTFDFLIPTTTFAEHLGQFGAPAVGFGPLIANEPVGVLWGPLDGVFASWDTTTPIGPINGPGFHLGWGFQSMETTGGVLAFDDTDLGGELPPFTFTAADLVCDDVTEIAWLSVAPESGTTPPEGSEPVSVTVDATGLSPGTFDATLCVLTNDPGTPLVPVPVTLTVIEGGAPELIFDPSSLDFGEVAVGETSPPQAATLENAGDADATGLSFSPPGSGFEADTSTCGDTLPAGEGCVVSITFTPGEPGAAEAALEVTSDQDASASLGLSGNGIGDEGFTAMTLEVDPHELGSDGNGVFEPGELVEVAPAWRNDGTTPQDLSGDASDFTGPEGATYTLAHDGADYGTLDHDQTASCLETGVCYQVSLDDPAVRPATHWEATFNETLDDTDGTTKTWTLHIGDSFVDMPRANLFYPSVETLLHHGVTGGCTDTEYCPTANNTRDQMPVFVLRAVEGPDYQPPTCVEGDEVFHDVSAGNVFCPWIQELANRGVVNGCGGDNYCPNAPVTRGQMAIFLLRTLEGSDYEPPACTGQFVDVPCPSMFADWIEELFAREITGGCSNQPLRYCPANPVNREQMAAFIGKAFGLTLYEP